MPYKETQINLLIFYTFYIIIYNNKHIKQVIYGDIN